MLIELLYNSKHVFFITCKPVSSTQLQYIYFQESLRACALLIWLYLHDIFYDFKLYCIHSQNFIFNPEFQISRTALQVRARIPILAFRRPSEVFWQVNYSFSLQLPDPNRAFHEVFLRHNNYICVINETRHTTTLLWPFNAAFKQLRDTLNS